jgi:hypothetical protein
MSYPLQGYGAPGARDGAPSKGQVGKGSVRAARERLLATQQGQVIPSNPQQPSPIRENPLMSQYSSTRAPAPSPKQRKQRPMPMPENEPPPQEPSSGSQWPLDSDIKPARVPLRPDGQPRPPPQRPPRPANAPDFFDSRSPNDSTGQSDDDYLSPNSYASPNPNRQTTSSAGSNASSLGTIPDFPVPSNAMQPARRNQNLGPPPSARRGPSSYYSQASYVSPIVEESENRTSHGSFASSNVIPSGVPEFFLEEEEEEEENLSDDEGAEFEKADSGPMPEKGLVRQASLGKRAKPTLTSVKGSDTARSTPPSSRGRQQRSGTPGGNSLGSERSVLLDASTSPSSSEEDLEKAALRMKRNNKSTDSLRDERPRSPAAMIRGLISPRSMNSPGSRSRSPLSIVSPVDSSVEKILGGLQKGGALDSNAMSQLRQPPKSGLGDRVGVRRPPKLNVDAVRDAEARGSITSLPDLIRRATRLAANLDRGKTASRLGMDWMFDEKERRNGSSERLSVDKDGLRRSGGSLAEMINAFPNPGVMTPTDGTVWPSGTSSQRRLNSRREMESGKNRRGRRCCGLPLWGFIFLVIILLILVAAAVVIPIVLIVLPRRNAAAAASSANQKAQCESKSPCENGGTVTVLSDGTCSCICSNGFTGPRCLNTEDAGCSTIFLAGTNNATIGTEISSLLSKASTKFSIPLDGASILSLFAQNNFSCSAENSLVTFTGFSSGKVRKRSDPTTIIIVKPSTTPSPSLGFDLVRRDDNQNEGVTSSGLLVDGPQQAATPTAAYSSYIGTVTLPSATASSATPTSTSTINAPGTNSTSQDFAKVGILFVMQQSSSISTAVAAQQKLEQFLTSAVKEGVGANAAMNVSMGAGFSIDLVDLTLTVPNGTIYGHGGNGTVTSATPSTTAAKK